MKINACMEDGTVEVRFRLRSWQMKWVKEFFDAINEKAFYEAITVNTAIDTKPLHCTGVQERGSHKFVIDIPLSGLSSLQDKLTWPIEEVKYWFAEMEKCGLITKPVFSVKTPHSSEETEHLHVDTVFTDAPNKLIRTVFASSGSILELYAWYEAVSRNCFYDACPNFGFSWDEGKIKNELDLVLTKGLRTAIVSCKATAVRREHVYEILYLTKRFSLNSIPVLLCQQNRHATDQYPYGIDKDKKLIPISPSERDRINAMGVKFIVMDELNDEGRTLGNEFEGMFDE